jgi:DHA1 family multidrug resistance protein-like MFS transporter
MVVTPEETIDHHQPLPSWKRTLYAVWIAQTLAIIGFSLRVPFLPFYLQDLGADSADQAAVWSGLINAGGAGVMAITAPIWGVVSDRYGRKPMLLRSMFAATITVGLMGFATAPWQLLVLRFIEGAFTGTVTASTALVAASAPKERLGYSLGLVQTAVFSGASLGPLFGGLLAAQLGYRPTFLIAAAMLGSAGLIVLFFVQEQFTPVPRGAERGLRAFRASTSWLMSSLMLTMIGVMICVRLASSITQPFIPLFIESIEPVISDQRSSLLAGLAFGVLGLTSAISSIWFGKLGDRRGHRPVLFWCALGAGLLYLPMALVQAPWQLIVLQGCFGVAAGGLIPSANAIAANATPPERRGVLYGVLAAAASIGGFIGPLSGAALATAFGFRITFAVTGMLLLGLAVVAARVFGRSFAKRSAAQVSSAG